MLDNSPRTRPSVTALTRSIVAVSALLTCLALLCAPTSASASEQPSDDWKVVVGDQVYNPSEIKPQATECTSKMDSQKIQYSTQLDYAADGSGLVPGVSRIRCGNDNWGLRHIDLEHGDGENGKKSDHAWRNIVNKYPLGASNWEELMVFSYESILGAPQYASYKEANDTYRYTAPVKIIEKGEVKRTYHPLVVVSAESYNVITAYPRTK